MNSQSVTFPEHQFVAEQTAFTEPPFAGEPFDVAEQQGFTNADILWALGIWSVILCFSPVIVFYMLMVA